MPSIWEYLIPLGPIALGVMGAFMKPSRKWAIAFVVVGILSGAGSDYVIWQSGKQNQAASLLQNEGMLVPGDMPTPINACKPPPGALLVFLGPSATFYTEFPHTIISMGGDDILALNRDEKTGDLLVSVLRIFDDRNDVIARVYLENGVNRIHLGPTARMERPDEHSLVVYDHTDEKVLSLKFLNPTTLSIDGIFRHPDAPPIMMNAQRFSVDGISLGRACIHNGQIGSGSDRVHV